MSELEQDRGGGSPAAEDLPSTMLLVNEEAWWALDIKIAIEETPRLERLSDFMYAQLALICQDDVGDAVCRAETLQWFRQEHGIVDSFEEGCRGLEGLVALLPGWLLAFSFDESEGTYAFVHDLAKCDTRCLNTPQRLNKWFVGIYYMLHTFCPDLESVRKGVTTIGECEGVDWTRMPDFRVLKDLCLQLVASYPFTGHMSYYHTGVMTNLMLSMLRRIFPKNAHRSTKGLICDTRLDALCLVPTPEAATQRLLKAMQETLKRRFENESKFSLTRSSDILIAHP